MDQFRAAGVPIFGPTAAAAEIESSKVFAKRLMLRAGVPTAGAEHHTDPEHAKRAARNFGAPVVIKASGLAAGKGAVVCQTIAEADSAIDAMLREHALGAAGNDILIEEFMEGEELSVFGITDGEDVVPMLPAQDHKRLLEGDRGPNTGGMGAYAPVTIGDNTLVTTVVERIFRPTLDALRDSGRPFTGLLYAGLMVTANGPKVVEFNCRFGDPETETILPLLDSNLLDLLYAVGSGERLGPYRRLNWRSMASVTTVVAAAGYPDTSCRGDVVELPPERHGRHVFHAGTNRLTDGRLVTAGGRVLAITAVAETLAQAQGISTQGADQVHLNGKQFRRDLGWRELQRASARAS